MNTPCLASTGVTDLPALVVLAIALLVVGGVTVIAIRRRRALLVLALIPVVVGGLVFAGAPAPSFAAAGNCSSEAGTHVPPPMPSSTLSPETPTTVTTVDPTLVPSTECGVPSTVTLPMTVGVTYEAAGSPTTVTVTATADSGYVLDPAATIEWVFDVTATTCPTIVTPAAPTLVDDQCAMPVTFTTQAIDGVTYTSQTTYDAGTGIFTTTITAAANAGFEIPEGAQTAWVFASQVCTPGGGGGESGGGCTDPEQCGG